jgi:fructose-bisphosphate aldolase class II
MRASAKELLYRAYKNGYAIPAFNTLNLETTRGIVKAAENLRVPILVMTAYDCLEHMGMEAAYRGIDVIARESSMPVAIHLDHGRSYEEVAQALKLGYDSVMIDFSFLPFEENLRKTAEVVKMAHAMDTPIEAEVGHVPGGENTPTEEDESHAVYTDPDSAFKFVEETGVDFLAVSVGTVHGDYRHEPLLQFDLLSRIDKKIKKPLVLHGGSGTPWEQMERAVQLGVAKINVGTEIMRAFAAGITSVDPSCKDVRRYLIEGRLRIAEVVETKARNFRTKVWEG